MTAYVFDKSKAMKAIIPTGQLLELIHDENNWKITARVSSSLMIQNGEYIGFMCVDDHFRLFEVENAVNNDAKGVTDLTATDAIVDDLKEAITEEKQLIDVDLHTALKALLPGEEWVITGEQPDRLEKSRAYFTSAWDMVLIFEQLYEWSIVPFYTFNRGKIDKKVLKTEKAESVYRGRILNSTVDAGNVYLTKSGRPVTRLYGLGPATGSGDVQTNLTMADAVWSKSQGEPADKPKGQTWIADTEAEEENGVHPLVVQFPDAKDANDLLQQSWEDLQKRKLPATSVSASITDMELLPGHSDDKIRLGDRVGIRLKSGGSAIAKVVAIKRNYTHPWNTKITAGEETASIQRQVSTLIASATHTFERLTIYQNRFYEDEALIQLNAEHIQLNADSIIQHAEWIMLKADKIDLDGYVTAAEFETAIADLETAYATYIMTNEIDAGTAEVGTLIVSGSAAIPYASIGTLEMAGTVGSWKTLTVMTSRNATVTKTPLSLMGANGETVNVDVVTGISFSESSQQITYIGG